MSSAIEKLISDRAKLDGVLFENLHCFTLRPNGASEGFFPGCGQLVDVSRSSQTDFSTGDKSGQISFFPVETKQKTFFAKNVIRRCQISKSCPPPSHTFPTPMHNA